jgi:hypothetical protein
MLNMANSADDGGGWGGKRMVQDFGWEGAAWTGVEPVTRRTGV